MQYRKFGKTGAEVSALGFGCMRLPLTDPANSAAIDRTRAIKMIRDGIDAGVNYVDTAYPYHMGESERVVGEALQDGYREKVYLATKLPMWKVTKTEDFDLLLNEQLEKLKTDHVDFYLLHALNKERWELVLKLNLLDKLEEAKKDGRIRYAGFSFHDDLDCFKTIIDGYDKWDFCQIQFNYINTYDQAGLEGLEYAAARDIAVVIMEPLLGGKLANLSDQVKAKLPEGRDQVEWALDYLWNRPEVGTVLSGMSNEQQVADNLLYAGRSTVGMLSEAEVDCLKAAREVYQTMALVPCTKCEYCMPCPFGLEIPTIFEAYNQTAVRDRNEIKKAIYEPLAVKADACRKCRKCEKVCPQHIKISEVMGSVSAVFEH